MPSAEFCQLLVTEEDECLSMRTLTMKLVISRMSTGSGGVRQMVRLLSLKPSLKLKLI